MYTWLSYPVPCLIHHIDGTQAAKQPVEYQYPCQTVGLKGTLVIGLAIVQDVLCQEKVYFALYNKMGMLVLLNK